MIINEECRILFNAEGAYRIVTKQDYKPLFEGFRKKEKIVRNRPLPKWCISALEQGYWIDATSFEVEGQSPNFYLKVRGKVVKPLTKIEKKEEEYVSSTTEGYKILRYKVIYSRKRKYYNDFEEFLYSWEGWEEEKKVTISSLTNEEWETFKEKNPLPDKQETHWSTFIKKCTNITFEDEHAIITTCDKMQPHVKGCYYEYAFDKDCHPYIKETPLKDFLGEEYVNHVKEEVKYSSKTLLREYEETRSLGRHESNDGYGWRTLAGLYHIEEYKVIIKEKEYYYKKEQLIKTW